MSVSPIGGVTNVSSLLQPTAAQIAGAQGAVPGSATATAAQTSPTVDAAQAWEEAMRVAMGDESSSGDSSSDPLSSLATQTPASTPQSSLPAALAGQASTLATPTAATAATTPTAPATAAPAATTPLSPQALAALVSGNSTAPTDPLITSLSAPSDPIPQVAPASGDGADPYL